MPVEPLRLPRLRPASAPNAPADRSAGYDELAPYRPAILTIRALTTGVSLVLAAPGIAHGNRAETAWSLAIVAYTLFRVAQPITYRRDLASTARIIFEAAFFVAAICFSGGFGSPFLFSVLSAVALAGFAHGLSFALRIGAASAVAVGIASALDHTSDVQGATQWTLELVLVGLLAGYARRLTGEQQQVSTLALDRLGRMSDANQLLHSLHQMAQTLPSSLDLEEVLDSTMTQMRSLFDADALAVLLFDDTDSRWVVARAHGSRTLSRFSSGELPGPLNNVLQHRQRVVQRDLSAGPGHGLAPGMQSGLYGLLESRNAVVGLVSVEFAEPDRVTPRDLDLLEGLVEPAGLAIDNARWFGRIRTVGADEERNRIARDLHDRIAQSLAYLGFELDRIVQSNREGEAITEPLDQLREDVRSVVGEVRDTLYDLRTDVSDSQDMTSTLDAFVQRVQTRSRLEIVLDCDEKARLPLRQEREMWRIAQEAITNVERHAKANLVTVRWRCDGRTAELFVKDDGIGFPSGRAGRLDSYGVLGMRERASSIGASLDISGEADKGTTVRCELRRV
jgi:signal transduction histidine kinase